MSDGTAAASIIRVTAAENNMLKGVSRSFYLSLRLLPSPMRRAAGLGYLLARTSDTLADTAAVEVEVRLLCLDWFRRALTAEESPPRWPIPLLNGVADPRERRLLESTAELIDRLHALPAEEAELVREVTGVILGGQQLDLERFGAADAGHPVALPDAAALEDYTWRVAGCVGAFWTRLGFLTLGDAFSNLQPGTLEDLGIRYGKGLQLVNVLRDLPADLADGRCYLPVGEPLDTEALMECHREWLERAVEWVGAGHAYANSLRSRRLRVASGLPAHIAAGTLARMRNIGWQQLCKRVRVPRIVVYGSLVRGFASRQSV